MPQFAFFSLLRKAIVELQRCFLLVKSQVMNFNHFMVVYGFLKHILINMSTHFKLFTCHLMLLHFMSLGNAGKDEVR